MKPKQLDMFHIGVKSTPQSQLNIFKSIHGILTYRTKGMKRDEEPWIALIPFDEDKDKSIDEIMAEKCAVYESSRNFVTGTGELSAIRELCYQLNINCPL